jgi:hypothetical protein
MAIVNEIPLPSAGDRALDELEQVIQEQAQRLEDLLAQARLASAELRLSLRKIAPALEGLDGEGPASPGGWKRRRQLG